MRRLSLEIEEALVGVDNNTLRELVGGVVGRVPVEASTRYRVADLAGTSVLRADDRRARGADAQSRGHGDKVGQSTDRANAAVDRG